MDTAFRCSRFGRLATPSGAPDSRGQDRQQAAHEHHPGHPAIQRSAPAAGQAENDANGPEKRRRGSRMKGSKHRETGVAEVSCGQQANPKITSFPGSNFDGQQCRLQFLCSESRVVSSRVPRGDSTASPACFKPLRTSGGTTGCSTSTRRHLAPCPRMTSRGNDRQPPRPRPPHGFRQDPAVPPFANSNFYG